MLDMTTEEKRSYHWAIGQRFQSVAATHARTLAKFIERHTDPKPATAILGTENPAKLETREKQIICMSGYYKEQGEEPGSFYKALIEAFFWADRNNMRRLAGAFPTTAQAFKNYMSGSLKEKYGLPED
jgi:hypothetical protein